MNSLFCVSVVLIALNTVKGSSHNYFGPQKDHFLTDAFLREVVNRMGKDLADVAADSYVDFPESNHLDPRSPKYMGNEEQLFSLDYNGLGDTNPNPSTRDQEYLQHSTLWSNQYSSGEVKQPSKPESNKDSSLPAYCDPPNPCPVGYGEDQGCIPSEKFEDTAAFSRDWQASQDCMCDTEHMFDCPTNRESMNDVFNDLDFDRFMARTGLKQIRDRVVAKKFAPTNFKDDNPFLQGERLPVAAKKGNNVVY